MQNTYEILNEYPEYPLENNEVISDFINDPLCENETVPLSTYPLPEFQTTRCTISQQNNNLSIYQKIQMAAKTINSFEESINRQLEQVNELKDQLNQMKQFFITQQQHQPQQQLPSMSRRIYRNHVPRPHPYLNERPLVSSRTQNIRSAAPTYRHECFTSERVISPNNFQQQINVPAETVNNNVAFSAGTQNYEFW
ncbi:hypothetical protein RclHR1_04790008 [Rhizophagus clarus]|uniref:Uncharacterized protein n=1 Tax=Rhizophagus clarus TaxID=94130 RepID=A0A2Z6SD62_9GLOM|nr:hypothetical protein RclHR1_04790008 [Rhizophagus clarus]GES95889.1 hypothetical protein GLOIN_2v1469349 [Rhizophagus clarus]